MAARSRLALYREVFARIAAQKARAKPILSEPEVDAETLTEAFASALSRFTTQDGSLKVANQTGSHMKGGG